MKILGFIVLGLVIVFTVIYAYAKYRLSHVEDKKDLQASINKQVEKYLAHGNTYGLVVGIYKDGISWIQGYGTTVKGKAILPDSTSLFELASTSKLFTTSTLQLLIDRRDLNADDCIQTLLKDKVELPPIARQTTLLHLATHLSGFPSLPNAFIEKMKDESNPYKDLVRQDMYAYLRTCEGKQPDGTFEYSNFGMGLLGHLLELRSGKGYEALVKESLLAPLQMHNTFVTIDSIHRSKVVQGYDENGNEAPIWTDNVLTGAGSFLSSASDMLHFIKANLGENESPISRSLLRTHQQQLDGDCGLGWVLPTSIDRFLGNTSIVWHDGMAGGYTSYLAVDQANQCGIIVLSNKAVDVTNLGMKLMATTRTQSWKQ